MCFIITGVCLEVTILKAGFWKPPLNSDLRILGSFIPDGRHRLRTNSMWSKMVEHSLPNEIVFFNGLH